mgnify:FL=1|jgi:inorganic pyrophosphatase
MMTDQQLADRKALIQTIAERKAKLAKVQAKSKALPTRLPKKARSFMDLPKNEHVNINQWTDASSYAQEYYGEVKYHTQRFDNDWN